MPAGDGTGPMGQGPMTGRATGYCAGFQMPGNMNSSLGRGRGRGQGCGQGRGWRRGRFGMGGPERFEGASYPEAPAYGGASLPEQEAQALKAQVERFEATLADIKKRLGELETVEGKDR